MPTPPPPPEFPPPEVAAVTVWAPAKLNLSLAVGRPDAQTRLHPISSRMIALDFADTVAVERLPAEDSSGTDSSLFTIAFADDAPRRQAVDWPLDRDLASRAHHLIEASAGRPLPVAATISKRIPTGAGLGGGSADAAAMIVALDQLFRLELSTDDTAKIADQLGSDVHFSLAVLRGENACLVSGIGQAVASDSLDPPIHLALVLPDFGCPTGPVYAAFDRLGLGRARLETPKPGDRVNDLEPAAVAVEPRLGDLLETLRRSLGRPVHLTGSGAACFVIADDADHAGTLARTAREATGQTAIATRSRRAT
ncbi:MAG: hypothetical protein AAFX76_09725 [Planctomycetota bacterium]